MTTVALSPTTVADYPDGGGHFWVFMQYALALRRLGCDVVWFERFPDSGDAAVDARALRLFRGRMAAFGFADAIVLYRDGEDDAITFLDRPVRDTERLLARCDFLLNFHYAIAPQVLARFRRTALVDIDPGLLQTWIAAGRVSVARHDHYFSTGETVGTPGARFSDCGLPWRRIRPAIDLPSWPVQSVRGETSFTTVSGWWGNEWFWDGVGEVLDNNKRAAFMAYADLPRRTGERLELALNYGEGDEDDMASLRAHGWRIRHAYDVARGPDEYRRYVQQSRGEFSCAKASCMHLANAWVSDRTLCYLASGRPVVVQHTGPSAFLPDGLGMFRFRSMEEAVAALDAIGGSYQKHADAARAIAETWFSAAVIVGGILDACLATASFATGPANPPLEC